MKVAGALCSLLRLDPFSHFTTSSQQTAPLSVSHWVPPCPLPPSAVAEIANWETSCLSGSFCRGHTDYGIVSLAQVSWLKNCQ